MLSLCGFVLTGFFFSLGENQSNRTPFSETQIQNKFALVDEAHTGITFKNEVPIYAKMNVLLSQYHYNGGGVSVGDINNDGLPDVFFVSNFGPDALYLNKGNFQFEDITDKAGVKGFMSWETGSNFFDINNDGYLDLLVSRSGLAPGTPSSNLIYINNGDLTFSEKATDFGISDSDNSTQTAVIDYDRDGDLDLFVLNHNVNRITSYNFESNNLIRYPKVGDRLYRNDGGKYTDVTLSAGIIGKEISYGLGVMVGDINEDGWPDIYVCNDFGEKDYLYVNKGDGTFEEKIDQWIDHISYYSMGGDLADYNNDGRLDLFVLDMTAQDNFRQKANMNDMNPDKFWFLVEQGMHYQYMVNTLQLNNGNGSFSEIANLAGIAFTDWSWAPLVVDFNNDGLKDLYVTNGYRVDISNKDFRDWYKKWEQDLASSSLSEEDYAKEFEKVFSKMESNPIPNYMFLNNGDLTFEDVSKEFGMDQPSFSNGAAYGDLDGDGDLDLVVNNLDQTAFIYENNASESANYLRLKLNGPKNNRMGIGTKIWLTADEKTQFQEFYVSRGFQSSVEPVIHFGLGNSELIEELKIKWPDGKQQILKDISSNQLLLVDYSSAKEGVSDQSKPLTLVKDISKESGLIFKHQENTFNDFDREILLPHKLSSLGPAQSTGDLNGDGLADVFIGGAKDQPGTLFLQLQDGTFEKITAEALDKDAAYEDVGALFFDFDGDSDLDLYVVSGGNEYPKNSEMYQDRLYINTEGGKLINSEEVLPKNHTSGGVVAASDFDQDGDLDLFVGGRQIPGEYPRAANSYLLRNEGSQKFVDVTNDLAKEFVQLGMVTDASWTDMDKDGDLDLVVVGHWMSPCIFINEKGTLKNRTQAFGLQEMIGWWNTLSIEDFDQDGDPDFIMGNLGLNIKYKASPQEPFEVFLDDFDDNGSFDLVLGYYNVGNLFPVRGRSCSAQQVPSLANTFPTFNAFASATLTEIYGDENLQKALHYEATSFEHVYLENQGQETLVVKKLPAYAQTAPINDIAILDLNGDGLLDVLAGGNLYDTEVETTRIDAGKGLVILNEGEGVFRALDPGLSGFYIPGKVRNISTITLADNSQGLLVSKSDDNLQLFQVLQ